MNENQNLMSIDDVVAELLMKQKNANDKGIKINVIKRYQVHYEKHKKMHGTYRYLVNPEYSIKVQGRITYSLGMVDEEIMEVKC